MNELLLDPADLAEVSTALHQFDEEELDATALEELPIRLRALTFACTLAPHTNADNAWRGTFASLTRVGFGEMRSSTLVNLGRELRKLDIRRSFRLADVPSMRFEVLVLPRQLSELIRREHYSIEDQAGPEYFMEVLARLAAKFDRPGANGELLSMIADLIYTQGCEEASTLLSLLGEVLDPEAIDAL